MLSKEEIVNCLNNIIDKYYEKISEIGEDDYNEDLDDICCDINELIEKIKDGIENDDYYRGYNERDKLAKEICKECKYRKKVKELETDKQKLIEKLEEKEKLNDKYLQKLVYALSPTTHALGDSYNNAFKSIIADKIDLETCKIKRELKDCWEGRF